MSRPSDHIEADRPGFEPRDVRKPSRASGNGGKPKQTGPVVTVLRGLWTWLTSMRTAIILLLLLALAAVPGSLFPQRSSDPNGVTVYFNENPDLAPRLDDWGLFDVYSTWWFSSIYILLFISLVGCILPRTTHHLKALRSKPPRTPARLSRMDAYAEVQLDDKWVGREGEIIASARDTLRKSRYRTEIYDGGKRGISVSAERGYVRETGNLIFHIAMLGVILSVGFLSGFNWHGQRVLVEGQTFVNGLVSYSSFNPGRFFTPDQLPPYSMKLNELDVTYETENENAIGIPIDYTAHVTVTHPGEGPTDTTIRVNDPLRLDGTDTYLLANGYAPTITVRDPEGNEVFRDSVAFIPQDNFLTSTGVVKVPDGLAEQVGFLGFFYPTAAQLDSGALTSVHQDLHNPMLTFNVYVGDLGLDTGMPVSVYSLDTTDLTQIAGRDMAVQAIELAPGDTVELPNGLGTMTLDAEIPRYASFDVHRDYTRVPVATFVFLAIAGLVTSLLVPRRRVWVKVTKNAEGVLLEFAGLARGEDHQLARAVNDLVDAQTQKLVSLRATPATAGDAGDGKSGQ
ncbi:cytochrome c biogenesis protein ResB [Gulosibacter molinativorax]|uniref:Cytochrome c biogenesis protein ResB n=1 Tax=Gulosibacter molinativorax TaxID=256821 RepID=A0ABT7CAX5_9MICO|nr:cytochrome c biogenesis protein ResB [Gulosibacter molinativorax]MDJ1372310.1 cytochrome c biogenesis protein ResB [Gulosibacter molinativorax]QUY63404.1 Cytochrome C biosynthesis associated protein [Gulosibacter molinativorax]